LDTFELLPSLAQGDLRDASAAELVAAVFRARASGTLSLEAKDTGEIRTFFRAGDMCGTGVFAGFRTLAHVLLANDWVDAVAIDESREESARTRKRHGEVLVANSLLTPDQLRAALLSQHRQNLGALLALAEGGYEWRGWEPPPPWAREVSVDPVAAIADAMAMPLLVPRRRKILDWVGSQVLRLSVEWPELEPKSALRSNEKRALAALANPRPIPDFVRASGLPGERAEALVAALLLCGGLEAGEPTSEHPSRTTPPHSSSHAARPMELELELPEAEEPLQLDLDESPTARFEAPPEAREFPPETEFELAPDTEAAEIRTPMASAGIATEPRMTPLATPPPVAPIPAAAPAASEPVDAPADPQADERARNLRRRMRERGQRNLGVGVNRDAVEGGTRIPTPAHSPPVNPHAMDAETRSFVDEVRMRAARLDRCNAYERLGISPSATQDHIRQAYITAAKRFHPDRVSSNLALAAVLPQLQALFSGLKEAHDYICTPDARKAYDIRIRAGGGSAKSESRKEEASLALKMGDVLFKKRDFEAAIVKLRRAVELDPTADALAALAWALTADPKSSPAAKEEALALIPKALRADRISARAYYVAGVLYRTNDPAGSADAFRRALEVDPSHAEASLQLRLLEMRGGGKATPKGSGVLSGIFGKRKP
jgi:tetratricopeptide (TPR) repeat protein